MGRRIITADDAEVTASMMMSKFGAGQGDKDALKVPEVDTYFTKLLKYIPAEIISGYVAINAIFKSIEDVSDAFQWVVVAALTVLTALYIMRLTNEPGKTMALSQVLISTFAFLVWVFALGGPFANLDWYQYYYGAILLVIYTLSVPVLVGKKSA